MALISTYLLVPLFLIICIYIINYRTPADQRAKIGMFLGVALISLTIGIISFAPYVANAFLYILQLAMILPYFYGVYRLDKAKKIYKVPFILLGWILILIPFLLVGSVDGNDGYAIIWLACVLYCFFFYLIALKRPKHLRSYKLYATLILIAAFGGVHIYHQLPPMQQSTGPISRQSIFLLSCLTALVLLQYSLNLSIRNFRHYPFTYWINWFFPLVYFFEAAWFQWWLYRVQHWSDHITGIIQQPKTTDAARALFLQSIDMGFPHKAFHTFVYGSVPILAICLIFAARVLYVWHKENGSIFD